MSFQDLTDLQHDRHLQSIDELEKQGLIEAEERRKEAEERERMIEAGLIERECIPYFEGVKDKYERIGKMFWIGHPEQVVNPLTAAPFD